MKCKKYIDRSECCFPVPGLHEEGLLNIIDLSLNRVNCIDENLAGVVANCLYFDFYFGFEWVWYFVSCELNFLVLEEMHADEITDRVIF